MQSFKIADDVYAIDLEMFDTEVLAAYVVDSDEPLLVETGYPNGVDILRDGLESVGVAFSDIEHAVISHVHIDHSGGAAALVEANPDVSVYIHEATADHLLDPVALIDSSRDAMGVHFEKMGEPDPIPAENVVRVNNDGAEVHLGDRSVSVVSTPGHAPDHLSVWDPQGGTLFANEAIGSYYPRMERWLPPSTLPHFDIEAVRETITNLREFDADRLAMSHFGVRPDPEAALEAAAAALDRFERRITQLYEEHGDLEATEHAVRAELVALEGYDGAIEDFETRFQTQGFLRYAGLL